MEKLIISIKQFVELNKNDVEIVTKLFKRKLINKGELFLKEGLVCDNLAFIEKGLLRHFINDEGRDITYHFSMENDFVCDYQSFINRLPSLKNIVTIENTSVYLISDQDLQIFYQTISTGERFGRLLLEKIFSNAITHIISTHTDSAEQRYLKFLSAFPELGQRVPQYYVASFICVKPPSLSRIRKKIANNNFLT
ncbi:MAG: Crp/Fnr family transcriptional regulator [Ferruginibacter sp.]